MKIRILLMALGSAMVMFIGSAFAGPNINPGLWEITTETEMVGMQGMNVPPQTHTQCLTQEDLVPQSEEASKECQIMDVRQSGSTIFWKIICSGQNGSMEGTGAITYHGDSLDGVMDMVIQGANMQIKNTIRGYRIGECTAQQQNIENQQQPMTQNANAGQTVTDDVKDVGQAARDEAKQSTINEVRDGVNEGVRKLFKGFFK